MQEPVTLEWQKFHKLTAAREGKGVRNHFVARGGPAPSSPTSTQLYTALDQADLKK